MAAELPRRTAPARPPPPRATAGESGRMEPSAPQDNVTSSTCLSSDIKTFQDMQRFHDLVYHHVDTALAAEERNDKAVAVSGYTEGLQLIDVALRVDCSKLTRCSLDQINKAKDMQVKMSKTKQQLAYRLQELQSQQPAQGFNEILQPIDSTDDCPPSYEEAMSEGPPSISEEEMMALGESIWASERASQQPPANATSLYQIPDGVQIFFISPDGLVSAPSYPSSLNVVKFEDNDQRTQPFGAPPAFLHVGDWMYPLVPGTSPALHTNYGAYLFPDIMGSQPGAAVGLILPDTLPLPERQRFEEMIRSFTVMREQMVEPEGATAPPYEQEVCPGHRTIQRGQEEDMDEEVTPNDTSSKISKGILVAADWISWGVRKGAEKGGELIKAGSQKLRERMDQGEKARTVDPRVQKGVVYARQATNATVKVTGFIVSKLGEATMALARQVAPHLRKEGEKLIPKSLTKQKGDGKSTLDGVVEVAASGLQGFGTVYIGLETAAKSLGKSIANETVNVVQHRYGAQVGQLTENTMYAAGNCALTAYNANSIGVKAVAKRAAKDTGKAVLEDLNKQKKNEKNGASGGSQQCNGATGSDQRMQRKEF